MESNTVEAMVDLAKVKHTPIAHCPSEVVDILLKHGYIRDAIKCVTIQICASKCHRAKQK